MMMGRKLLGLLISFLFISVGLSSNYYADIDIVVDNNGELSISGLTNYNFSSIENRLYKNGPYWVLNLTTEEQFSTYVYDLSLPKGAVINYLSTTKLSSIGEENGHIVISAVGDDEPFKLVVQYRLEDRYEDWIIYLGTIVIVVVIVWLNLKKPSKKKIDYSILTEREKKIVKLIEKKGKVRQYELYSELNLPKSSISRNVKSLVKKGVIKKVRYGMSNILMLK